MAKQATYILIEPATGDVIGRPERFTRREQAERNTELWIEGHTRRWVWSAYVPAYLALYQKGIRNHE